MSNSGRRYPERSLKAQSPLRTIDGEDGNAPSGATPGESLLRAGFAVAVAVDYDGNKTSDLRNESMKELWMAVK